MEKWKSVLVKPDTPALDVLRLIDSTRLQIAMVVDGEGRLLGTVTDGDVRRALLSGTSLASPVTEIMFRTPTTAAPETDPATLMGLMQAKVLRQIPIVDAEGRVVGLETIMSLMARSELENPVVLMAGGRGERLRPLTDTCPKPLLRVGGKPILERILETFLAQGFRRFYISVNYRAEMVESHFGDGSKFGASITYLREDKPLGTAGALTLLPQLDLPFLVMNGDLLTNVNFAHLLEFHVEQGAAATMCVRDYTMQIPFGVVRAEGNRLVGIDEKPSRTVFVNAGIYVLSPQVLPLLPPGEPYDMPRLFEAIVAQSGKAAVFPVRDAWLDIGRMDDYERAQQDCLPLDS